ncbi:sensor histidine kinase [Streptomyces sp. NPDC057554]|uniref:sensor histidine kinase n=1 Tax=Streptomyces sp. NPDC057554 TaxID=3350538 RepID=UPI0036801261
MRPHSLHRTVARRTDDTARADTDHDGGRLGTAALATAFVLLLLVDWVMSLDAAGPLLPLAGLLPVGLALIRPAGGLKPPLVYLAAGWSLALSLLMLLRGTATDTPGLAELLALAALLIANARRSGPLVSSLGTCGALTLALLLQAARVAQSTDGTALAILMVTLVAAAAIGRGLQLRAQDARRLRMMQRIRQGERLELARDLHDFVAHHVTGIVVLAQAGRAVWESAPCKVGDIFNDIELAGARTMDSMQQLVTVLREEDGSSTASSASLHGIAQIPALVESFRRGGPPVRLELGEDVRTMELPPEVATTAHRIVTEGLTNIRQHAPHSTGVLVRVTRETAGLAVRVRNEPAAASGKRSLRISGRGRPGYGLVGLHERVSAVGGSLVSGPDDSGGWEVSAVIPIRDSDISARKASP